MNVWQKTCFGKATISVLAAVLIALLVQGSPVHARPDAWATLGHHTVQAGETLYCISRAYGISPWALATHNGIVNPSLVYPGRVLAIPNAYMTLPAGPVCARQFPGPGPVPCTCATHHTVVSGDNLYRLSLHHGVSMWRIAECNGIINLNYIRVGQILCIPAP
jgi:LysM repeat protein